MDINGKESQEASYIFTIRPPFYRTWWAFLCYFILAGSFVLTVVKWRNYLFEKEKHKLERIIADRTEELVKQKERAEQLISNILPKQTADELKTAGRSTRKKYKMVTVLFSDIQGFGNISEQMNPELLLDELDKYFRRFDEVVERLNIEKVKTVGDTYMCAGGIPTKNRTNPIDVVMAALEMREHMDQIRRKSQNDWNIRIGIHSGPVIAGVVGIKKISYDIWGDTVNIASRMEASGKTGEICISEVTRELVHPFFECEPYRKIPVKYKGDIGMYFVKGLKRRYAADEKGVVPNKNFITKLQMIRFDDLEELIMTKLDKGLPKNLYYHNMKHTIDVITQVELIGRKEGISDEEMLLLKTGALFHDAGFLSGYDEHELLGIKLACEILPDFYYSEDQIKTVSELIYVTKMPPDPKNLLEQIICDADLDYLGRTDFLPVSQNLFRELYEHGKIKSIEEWNKLQVKFITGHVYYTETARELREVNKKKQLEKIRSMI
ncbi:MAG: guanylate cyclase [Bacteroidetes bacterium]|nr:guanylate cyclase [Bacteroidota bacterium]